MSAQTATTVPGGNVPPPANGSIVSPVDVVRAMPPEGKQAVLLALLREAVAANGDSVLLAIDDEDGKSFGYYVPPRLAAAQLAQHGPVLSDEDRRRTDRALADLTRTFDIKELLDEPDDGPG